MNRLLRPIALLLLSGAALGAAAEPANVTFIKKVFPDQKSWQAMFPIAYSNQLCNGPEVLTRENFLTVVAKYPGFLSADSTEGKVRELAAFLGNSSQETTGAYCNAPTAEDDLLDYQNPVHCNEPMGGLCYVAEVGDARKTDYCHVVSDEWIDSNPNRDLIRANCDKRLYYGRGALQTTNPYTYATTSDFLYGDQRILLENPDKLIEGTNAWDAALYFWMKHEGGLEQSATSVNGRMTAHQALAEHGDYGKAIEVINGNLECGVVARDKAYKVMGRVRYYMAYLKAFGEAVGTEVPAEKLTCISAVKDGGAGPAPGPEPTATGQRCGKTWGEANAMCGKLCANKGDCGEGENCFADLDESVCK